MSENEFDSGAAYYAAIGIPIPTEIKRQEDEMPKKKPFKWDRGLGESLSCVNRVDTTCSYGEKGNEDIN
jgi:hypothetical protein